MPIVPCVAKPGAYRIRKAFDREAAALSSLRMPYKQGGDDARVAEGIDSEWRANTDVRGQDAS